MIKVGIHNNVQMTKATTNDRGTLVWGIKKVTTNKLADFDAASDDSASDTEENDFLFFPPQATAKDGSIDTAENNSTKIKELKDQLSHILLRFMPSSQIKWDTLKDTGVTNENFEEKLTQQPILDKMYENIVADFIEMATPFIGPSAPLSRILLTRQSKAKHFPALRKRYLKTQPFFESMDVPQERSALKYTPWELENGFNNPNKVEEVDVNDSSAASTVDAIFNQ